MTMMNQGMIIPFDPSCAFVGKSQTSLLPVVCLDKFRPTDLGCHSPGSMGFGVIL